MDLLRCWIPRRWRKLGVGLTTNTMESSHSVRFMSCIEHRLSRILLATVKGLIKTCWSEYSFMRLISSSRSSPSRTCYRSQHLDRNSAVLTSQAPQNTPPGCENVVIHSGNGPLEFFTNHKRHLNDITPSESSFSNITRIPLAIALTVVPMMICLQ